jgi:asparagine synthetase B (glutamine-hydrolysing)
VLLAISAPGAGDTGRDIATRVVSRFGKPDTLIERAGSILGSWRAAAGERVDVEGGFVLEGWSDWDEKPTPDSLSCARGDFVLMALQAEGILLGSGLASGFRPIYVASLPCGVSVAGTRLAALRMLIDDREALDLDAVCAYCVLQAFPPPDSTPYSQIRQVPMGEAWIICGAAKPRRIKSSRPFRGETLLASEDEYAERMRHEVTASIRRATHGATRVALSVSGGLDSGTILSVLCHEAQSGRKTPSFDAFALSFDGAPEWDDRPFRRALSERWSVSIHEIEPAGPGFSAAALLGHLVIDGMPCRAVGLPLGGEIARRAKTFGSRVLITGEGGDDVLNGQAGFYGDLLRKGHLVTALRGVWGLRALPWRRHPRWRSLLQLRTALSPFEPRSVRRHRQRRWLDQHYPWAGPRLRRLLDRVASDQRPRIPVDASPEDRYRELLSMRVFADSPRIRSQEEVVGGHVHRAPFLDDEFLRFVATLPPLTLLQGGYKRGLLRNSMRGLLPESLRIRQTKSFIEPAFLDMTAGRGVRILEELIDVRMLADLGIVEPKRFRAHYEDVAAQPLKRGWVYLWTFAAAEAFLRMNAGAGSYGASWS